MTSAQLVAIESRWALRNGTYEVGISFDSRSAWLTSIWRSVSDEPPILARMRDADCHPMFGLVEIGDLVEGFQLALLGALAVADVQHRKLALPRRDRRRYATVHSATR